MSRYLNTQLLATIMVCCITPCLVAETKQRTNQPVTALSQLHEIEQRVLPQPLRAGPNRFDVLTDYYWHENQHLRRRFEHANQIYRRDRNTTLRWLTLVSGSAGIGKTFFKKAVMDKGYSKNVLCSIDLRKLYDRWSQEGRAEYRPDLRAGAIILNQLPAQIKVNSGALSDYLRVQNAAFYAIDSLDEVHPDDYQSILEELEQFVKKSRSFVHVVVFGRGFAFRDYLGQRTTAQSSVNPAVDVQHFSLQPPRFVTTGDLLVSSWNYHGYKFGLAVEDHGVRQPMPLDRYLRWVVHGFSVADEFASVRFEKNDQMSRIANASLLEWAQNHRVVCSMLSNLAGNGIVRQICADCVRDGTAYDERKVEEAYLAAWLERETKANNRPSHVNGDHLDLYLRLLEEVAARFGRPDQIDHNGCFLLHDTDVVSVVFKGRALTVPAQQIIAHSGLDYVPTPGRLGCLNRFEPIWVHRLLLERRNERQRTEVVVQTGQLKR